MSEEIKVGDLVVRTKPEPCGCFSEDIGQIFTVKKLFMAVTVLENPLCSKCSSPVSVKLVVAAQDHDHLASTLCLKKIKPLSEPEETKITEEVPV